MMLQYQLQHIHQLVYIIIFRTKHMQYTISILQSNYTNFFIRIRTTSTVTLSILLNNVSNAILDTTGFPHNSKIADFSSLYTTNLQTRMKYTNLFQHCTVRHSCQYLHTITQLDTSFISTKCMQRRKMILYKPFKKPINFTKNLINSIRIGPQIQ